jgi:phenylacetate-CoA ligase
MAQYFDDLETRSADEREADLARDLPSIVVTAQALRGYVDSLSDVDASGITDRAALAKLPVLRKSQLSAAQKKMPPLGGYANAKPDYIFQSPGPIYEMGMTAKNWWRLGRFLHGAGVGAGDIVQNCFAYHLTPAGHIFENGAAAVGARVVPAGTGQTEQQVQAAAHLGVTAYAGTPDYLNALLLKGEEMGLDLSRISKALVSGGPLFPAMRAGYAARGIACLQCYATADLGNIAYESPAMEGMIVDEGVIVEIVTPGTGDPVADGEVGEVVVTSFNPDYPLIRFATGDLSAVMPGHSPCGRTNMRIVGWRGRADQATKVKGMFVRPEQVAELVARHEDVGKARVIVKRDQGVDVMTVQVETHAQDASAYEASVRDILKLRGTVEIVAPGALGRDGIVIEDKRDLT